ncbi:hypothetical protein IFM89_000084 [Coptis chinensis]|uniref:Uncharacterized protein n=1 Tax=Coptis chinensis TaxID=261450 RepID=A0A835I121_9MAGN|nr:hypothetical protein IFM89_000084 [Coptis chinensis]
MSASNTGSSGATSPATGLQLSDEELKRNPLWKYVTRLDRLSDGGGNTSWQCNFCNKPKKSSYTRVRADLLKLGGTGIAICPKVSTSDLSEMQILDDEVKLEASRKKGKCCLCVGHWMGWGAWDFNGKATGAARGAEGEDMIAAEGAVKLTTLEREDFLF